MIIGNILVFACADTHDDETEVFVFPSLYYSVADGVLAIGVALFSSYAEVCFKNLE